MILKDFNPAKLIQVLESAGLLIETRGVLPAHITGVADDSRDVRSGYLFVAVPGASLDGHNYLTSAKFNGAVVAVVEDASKTDLPAIVVNSARLAAAVIAAEFYAHPSNQLAMIGVTGTNGKTTTTSICRHLFDNSGNSASIGTIGALLGSEGEVVPGGAGFTTPVPVELQRLLRELVARGVKTVAMEVSSHSLDQGRIAGLKFDAAVFTNLTHDHLDYHGDMQRYFAAKAELLNYLKPDGVFVVNADDSVWGNLSSSARRLTFGMGAADVRAENVEFTSSGSVWTLRIGQASAPVLLPMIGDVNVSNALAAAATGYVFGMSVDEIAARLCTVPQVPGRLEILSDDPVILRDYAHTPDALRRVLQALRPLRGGGRSNAGRIILLFGCGGDRDRTKRPVMGSIAEEYADIVILTSDNPRTEDPQAILDDIEAGIKRGKHVRIVDRREAIARTIDMAQPGDIVLLAGKGHETYQIHGTAKYPFDEKEIVRSILGRNV